MDWIVIVILIFIALLAIAAIAVSLIGKYRAESAAAYEKRMTAEREYDVAILKAAKVLVVGNLAYVTRGVDIHNEIIYDVKAVDINGKPITTDVIDGEKITLHKIASKLVDESITKNGLGSIKLLTANEWEALGNDRELHGRAVGYLTPLGVYIRQGGRAQDQGTFVKDGMTLQTLLHDLSAYALPLAMGQPINKS